MDNIAQQVKFTIKEKEVATMIINGVSQGTRKIQHVVASCPNCSRVLINFDEGRQLVDIYKYLASQSPVTDIPKYCPSCGTKLMCDKSIVDEQVVEEQ